jgi:hypothetical protein
MREMLLDAPGEILAMLETQPKMLRAELAVTIGKSVSAVERAAAKVIVLGVARTGLFRLIEAKYDSDRCVASADLLVAAAGASIDFAEETA